MKSGRVVVGLMAGALLLAGCGSSDPTLTAPFGPCGSTVEELVSAAQAEGGLTLIAVPDNWANAGRIKSDFQRRYGIEVTTQLPQASSADELTIVRTWRGDPRMPDVIEVSPSAMETAVSEGLVERYRPQASKGLRAEYVDPNGYWVVPYGGFVAIATNVNRVDTVPRTWNDLLKPEYANAVALTGDPRESGGAFATVVAAALANGGSYDDVRPGVEYFAKLKKLGNLRPSKVMQNDLKNGEIPIVLDWVFRLEAVAAELAGAGIDYKIVNPADGHFGSYYMTGVVADAPHPCAARLWQEYLLSLEVGEIRVESGAVPATISELAKADRLPDEARTLLPPLDVIETMQFPTSAQREAMTAQIDELWGPLVANEPAAR